MRIGFGVVLSTLLIKALRGGWSVTWSIRSLFLFLKKS
jgi:hypothetical protein